MPRRGPEAGFHRMHYDFHGSGSEPHNIHVRFYRAKFKKNHTPAVPCGEVRRRFSPGKDDFFQIRAETLYLT